MKMNTSISASKNGRHTIHGEDFLELIQKRSFTDVIFLLWRGSFPKPNEKKLLDALLVSAVEHGIEPPSLYVPRIIASVGNPTHVALASGMLSIGTRHGGAIQGAAELLASKEKAADIVARHLTNKSPIPGLGHRVYKDADPRAEVLHTVAKKNKLNGKYFKKAYAMVREFNQQKGKFIPLNIDGAMAAGLLELGFTPHLSESLFLLSRLVGMAAHIKEEQEQNNPYYRLDGENS